MFTRTLTRYVLKELLTHSLSAAAIVIVLSCVRRLGTYLTDAAGGVLPFDAVLQLVGIRTVIALPSLLPAGVYVGILLGLRRLATDRELTALEASGVRPLRVAAVVMLFAFLSAVLVCVLALAVRPRAARTFDRIASVVHFTGLQPGRFYEFAGEDDLVIRAGAKAADGSMEEVFLQRREHGRVSIASCSAATEHIDRISGFRFLTLRDGYLYEFGSNPKLGPHSITDYRDAPDSRPLDLCSRPASAAFPP